MLVLTACSKRIEERPPQEKLAPARVTLQAVGEGTRLASEEVVGTVRAKLRAVIEAKLSGRIEQLPVTVGQHVKTGDLLAQLHAEESGAKRDQAVAMREQADSDLKRFTTLLQQEAVTRAEFDAVQARQRVAQAAVTEAEAMLGYARVTAPFEGVITRKYADVGDLASPGRPLLEMDDPTRLRLEADVPESLLEKLQPGGKLPVRIATRDQDLSATVAEIAPSSDPNSRTFLVKLDLPSEPGLRVGQFGRVFVPLGEASALRVPASAVVQRGQLELVFVLADGRAQLRLVKTGKRVGNEVELASGLQPGEKVVVEGAAGLVEGQPLESR
jgi:RND family efflux transporter MFP subunit